MARELLKSDQARQLLHASLMGGLDRTGESGSCGFPAWLLQLPVASARISVGNNFGRWFQTYAVPALCTRYRTRPNSKVQCQGVVSESYHCGTQHPIQGEAQTTSSWRTHAPCTGCRPCGVCAMIDAQSQCVGAGVFHHRYQCAHHAANQKELSA